MLRTTRGVLAVALLAGAAQGCSPDDATPAEPVSAAAARSEFRVFTATGDIAPQLVEFRAVLGDPSNGGTAGPLAGGRREIKWDGAPSGQLPGDFFNTTVKAGAVVHGSL